MKKKISVIVCAIVICLSCVFMSGCGCNMRCADFNYKYSRCLVYEKGVWVEYRVKSWSDYDDGTITVWTHDGQMIFTHTTNVIMYGEG